MYSYFPSCNFTRIYPQTSLRIKTFLRSRGVLVLGCCRVTHGQLSDPASPAFDTTPLTICQSCNLIVSERSGRDPVSLFEYLDSLTDVTWPSYHGEKMVLIDPYRSLQNENERKAVRSLLKKMEVDYTEAAPADFDGRFLYRPVAAGNLKLAPKAFSPYLDKVDPLSDDRYAAAMKAFMTEERFPTKRVVSYSNTAVPALKDYLPQGHTGVHVAELLFPED
ncbi:MAG TPA: hypothetical protein DEP00_06595 [Lachnospiraceae bacterium]|jgi:hypothetical protein|nr:hypothetical protein [Lachnospiraceae bacterium]